MVNSIAIAGAATDAEARIGGPGLIGGMAEWPVGPKGKPLLLLASLPGSFVSEHAGIPMDADCFVSVFTSYFKGEYFLDEITYDGDPVELAYLRKGATQVLVHRRGEAVEGAQSMPARKLEVVGPDAAGCSYYSVIGGEPRLLQEEDLQTEGLAFALQLYGGDVPDPFSDVFFLSDAVGYLYLPLSVAAEVDAQGLFFVQAT
jgi:hypothetical protein